MQQHLIGGQKQCKQGGLLGLRQGPELSGPLRGELERMRGAVIGLHGRSRPIGGKMQYGNVPGQLLTPIAGQALASFTSEQFGLPPHEIRIGHCDR